MYRILRCSAKNHHAKAISIASLGNTIMARSHKELVKAAYDYAAWLDGKPRGRSDLVSGYRNWLDRSDDLAGFEQLDDEGNPMARPTLRLAHSSERPLTAMQQKKVDADASKERARKAWLAMEAEKEAAAAS